MLAAFILGVVFFYCLLSLVMLDIVVLSAVAPFRPSLTFASKAGAYLSEALSRTPYSQG
jgi:hypothetical protein